MSDTKNMSPTQNSDVFKITKFSTNLPMNHAILLVVHLNELPKPTWIIVMCSFCISKSLENKPHKYIYTSITILPTTQPMLQSKIWKTKPSWPI